jgi:DNA mismatch repair protein MutS
VLLDEIGRGTSTYDGISIAWSVSEHLHDAVGCKTIFATHYHELTQLEDSLVAVRNYNVQVREAGDQVLFLHKLQPGGADRSYGIEVGRLAGLPPAVLVRAKELLKLLEAEQIVPPSGRASSPSPRAKDDQLGLFGSMSHPIVDHLRTLEPNRMTPIEALEILARLTDEAKHDASEARG